MVEKQKDDILALIARNLAGLTNSSEESELNEWIARSKQNLKYFEQVRNIWNESEKQINPEKINSNLALKKILKKVSRPNRIKILWYYWQRIAAIMILPLALAAILLIYINYSKNSTSDKVVYNEVYAAFGTRSAMKLADSTLVWLNSGSSLRYPDKFNSKKREVFLKGEAYFEVKSDVLHPFVVSTSDMQVTATGTKFNVFEYDSESVAEVTLISGNVGVIGYHGCDSQIIAEMKPGQHLEFNRATGIKNIINEDTYKYIAWKDGKLIFRNEPMSEVVNKISLLFNIDIELHGESLKNYRYRATFQEESLDEILKLLKLSSPIDFEELKRNPLPDGSFPKKKIIIFPSKQEVSDKSII